ncbi:hypothetical protein O1611_g76 [Lasiodiplodia mahajangana]|uniref:Uncharacterized protein n=1 Tax=Lasiodiplodia mahajangana TaxID=1108764 RepID=A0ACC2K1B5_9PEZI|nr:hypothetical protein O1611_g76 [Lasiodiplodia mahajangana]
MPQQLLAGSLAEDWSGLTSPGQRRKLQNRLNQRAYRRRQQSQRQHTRCDPSSQEGHLFLLDPQHRQAILQFARTAYENYLLNTPQPTQLDLLIRLNVINALARNAVILGVEPEGLCADDLVSPFNTSGPGLASWKSCPPQLHPTADQFNLVHHPWLDLFPIPELRNNSIRGIAAGVIDEDELCRDISEVNLEDTNSPSLIVWGEPWDVRGWEASVPFLKKWGWLVRGNRELITSTNFWRRVRGEAPITW